MNEKFNISDINRMVDNIAYSRYEHMDYGHIYDVSKQILEKINIQSLAVQQPIAPISKETAISLALEFFKSIDEEFYKKAKRVIDNEGENFSLNIYEIPEKDDGSYEFREKYMPEVKWDKGKGEGDIPLYGDIGDVYSIVHEISHSFDMPQKSNVSREIFADVTSECFERMLDGYLLTSAMISDEAKKDVLKQKKESINKTYFLALDYFIKYEFFDYKNRNGELTEEDVEEITKRFKLPKATVLEYLNDNSQDISWSARYVMGGVASEQYHKQYNYNPMEAIKNLKQYMELIKEDKGLEALEVLGTQFDYANLDNTLEQMNNQNSRLIGVLSVQRSNEVAKNNLKEQEKGNIFQKLLIALKNKLEVLKNKLLHQKTSQLQLPQNKGVSEKEKSFSEELRNYASLDLQQGGLGERNNQISKVNDSIILIGASGVGKSTIAEELSRKLNLPRLCLEKVANHYRDNGFRKQFKSSDDFNLFLIQDEIRKAQETDTQGIVDFGAGHSVFESHEMFNNARKLLKPFRNIVLLLPSVDIQESLSIINARSTGDIRDNLHFLQSPCNRELATMTIYTKDKTPDVISDEIVERISKRDLEQGKEIVEG